jgi:hypothetical protein
MFYQHLMDKERTPLSLLPPPQQEVLRANDEFKARLHADLGLGVHAIEDSCNPLTPPVTAATDAAAPPTAAAAAPSDCRGELRVKRPGVSCA